MPAPYRRLGRIAKAHGTTGEVTVVETGGLALDLPRDVDVWIVPPPKSGATPRRIESVRQGPKGLLVRISGVDTAADAHDLSARWLLASGSERPRDEDREAMLDLRVEDLSRGELGIVTDVIVTGANDVLVVDGDRFGQVLIPVIDGVVLGQRDGILSVALLDGLIDEDE